MTKTMSFDVSSVSTGFSCLDYDERSMAISLKAFGTINPPDTCDNIEKLFWFGKTADSLLWLHKPDFVVVEDTYLKNVKTLKTLMQFIGVLNYRVYEILRILPLSISPNSVRSFFGVKTKEEAFAYVVKRYKKQLRHLTFETGNDITDSILMGLHFIGGHLNEQSRS